MTLEQKTLKANATERNLEKTVSIHLLIQNIHKHVLHYSLENERRGTASNTELYRTKNETKIHNIFPSSYSTESGKII